MPQHPLPAEFAAMLHRLRIATEADALAPWQIAAIAIVTVLAAAWIESGQYIRSRKLAPGFRAGALMGLLVTSLASAILGWLSYQALTSGAIKCLSRHCHARSFSDVQGHSRAYGYVSMTFDAPAFWAYYGILTCATLLALFWLCSCLRALAHWRELD